MQSAVMAFADADSQEKAGLRTAFFSLVTRLQGLELPAGHATFSIDFHSASVLNYLKNQKVFTEVDLKPWSFFSDKDRAHVERCLLEANQLILDSDPILHGLVNKLIAAATPFDILNQKIEGGSVSGCIGMVYLCPKHDWKPTFYAEMLVHEYVHNRLFVDGMVNGIFPDLPSSGTLTRK